MDTNKDLDKISIEGFVRLAQVTNADSLEEALYYTADEEAKEMLNELYKTAINDPEHMKRVELLFELECLDKTEEQLEEMEKISQMRKLGYAGTSLEEISEKYDMPVEEVKKLFEKTAHVTIDVWKKTGLALKGEENINETTIKVKVGDSMELALDENISK